MANDTYIITPTDGNTTREFNVSPYSTNGTVSPISSTLDSNAIAADTSILFYGKGSDQWGERIQENFYHLMENFASDVEPFRPVNGQSWFDRKDNTLKIFQTSEIEVYDIFNNDLIVRIKGNTTSKYFPLNKTALISRFNASLQFDIFDTSNNLVNNYISSGAIDTSTTAYVVPNPADVGKLITVTLNTLNNISVPSTPGTTPILNQIGLWIPVFNTSTSILDSELLTLTSTNVYGQVNDLNVGENNLINVADPVNQLDGVNLQYLQANYTGSGATFLNSLNDVVLTAPTTNHILSYDGANWINQLNTFAAFTDTDFVKITGDTMTGNLIVNGTSTLNNLSLNSTVLTNVASPLALTDGVNVSYANSTYLRLSGDTLTGSLILNADPVLLLEAATKQYVDNATGGGGAVTLNGLTDVTLVAPANNEVLQYNGSLWVNALLTHLDSTGDTMSGVLSLAAQPGQNGNGGSTFPTHAATVQHVTDYVLSQFPNGDVQLASGLYDSFNDDLNLTLSDGSIVTVSGLASGIGTTLTITSSNTTHTISSVTTDFGDYLTSKFLIDGSFPILPINVILNSMSETLKHLIQPNFNEIIVTDNRLTPYTVPEYAIGFNTLQIFLNGMKNIANTRGKQVILSSDANHIYPNTSTGLNISTTYTFDIIVDGAAPLTISVNGANAQLYGTMINEINSTLNGVAIANIIRNEIVIFSNTTGSSSDVAVTDVDLFSTIDGFSGFTTTFNTPVLGVDYDYDEIGKYGEAGTTIQFTSQIPSGSNIEAISLSTIDKLGINY